MPLTLDQVVDALYDGYYERCKSLMIERDLVTFPPEAEEDEEEPPAIKARRKQAEATVRGVVDGKHSKPHLKFDLGQIMAHAQAGLPGDLQERFHSMALHYPGNLEEALMALKAPAPLTRYAFCD